MGAWLTSDGGAVTPVGSSRVEGSYTASQSLVDGSANVNGLIIRTLIMLPVGAAARGRVRSSGSSFALVYSVGYVLERDIFVPPGSSVNYAHDAGTVELVMTYDLL